MWVADGKLADVDNITAEVPEPEDNTAKIVMFAFVIFIFAAAGIGTMIYLRKKNDIERMKQKKREIAERENDKVKRRKGRENDILDKVLDDYSSDYVDEDEYADYFKQDDEQERGFRNDDEPLIFGRTGVSGTNPNSACIKPTAATEIYNEAVSVTAEMVQKMMNNDNVTANIRIIQTLHIQNILVDMERLIVMDIVEICRVRMYSQQIHSMKNHTAIRCHIFH